jgi:hypothetical protein
LSKLISDNNYYSISEFKNRGDVWLGQFLYSNDTKKSLLSEEDTKAVYYRCRFLRKHSFAFANNLINKMTNGIQEIIWNNKPEIVIAPMIDNYTLDILERVCTKNHIPYVSICGHLFNGYSRITSRGEYNFFPRTVSSNEIDSVLELLVNTNYTPQFHDNLNVALKDKYYFYYREMFKKMIYFPLMKIKEKDVYNYHYNTYLQGANLWNIANFININNEKYFSRFNDLSYSEKNIYFPLHLTPEATVDYWCDNPEYGANYEESILNIIKKSGKECQFLIKEHPTMYMMRNKKFYESLLSFENVKLIHPLENSNHVLEKTNIVFTENGSVGVEALLRNKLVICNSSNYYSEFHPNIHKRDMIKSEDLSLPIENYDNTFFIRDILQGNIKGRLFNNNNILKSDIDSIYYHIRNYCNYIVNNKNEYPQDDLFEKSIRYRDNKNSQKRPSNVCIYY